MKEPVMLLVAAMAAALTMPANAEEAGALPGLAAQPPSYFYTGKPYDADLGGYIFAYRSYDPGINRWTSPDPSGFPDGANSSIYSPVPTRQLDPLGLWYDENYNSSDALVDFITASVAVNGFGAGGFSIAQRLGDYALANDPVDHTGVGSFGNPELRLSPGDEIQMLRTDTAFTNIFTNDFIGGYTSGMTATDFSFQRLVEYAYSTDAGLAYGRVNFDVSGTFTYSGSGSDRMWNAAGNIFMFDDRYDFNPGSNNPAVAAMARLQYHDIAWNFVNSGEFSMDFSE